MNALRQAALDREKRQKEAEQAAGAEESKTKIEVNIGALKDMGEPDSDEDDLNEEDLAAWDDAYDDEDDVDPAVREAQRQAAIEEKLKKKVKEVVIEYRPPNYQKGTICQIVGDFTDWTPVNLNMYPVEEQNIDATKEGLFFITRWMIKGYRYRFHYVYRDYETLDRQGAMVSKNKQGNETNHIDIAASEKVE